MEVTKLYDPYFGTTTCATHIAALEIDPETYKVTLSRYVVAEDCGRLINPMIVEGQVHGAVAQGIGAALYEEIVYDETGQAADRQPRRLWYPGRKRGAGDHDPASRNRVSIDGRRLPRHGRRRDHRRPGSYCQRARRCAGAVWSRDLRAADAPAALVSPGREREEASVSTRQNGGR
jgi:Molybdopterin-binding domain of aldehyde dehydrogenase